MGLPGAWDNICVWSCLVTGISLRFLLPNRDGLIETGQGWQMREESFVFIVCPM